MLGAETRASRICAGQYEGSTLQVYPEPLTRCTLHHASKDGCPQGLDRANRLGCLLVLACQHFTRVTPNSSSWGGRWESTTKHGACWLCGHPMLATSLVGGTWRKRKRTETIHSTAKQRLVHSKHTSLLIHVHPANMMYIHVGPPPPKSGYGPERGR